MASYRCGLTPNSEFLKPQRQLYNAALGCGLTPNSEFLKQNTMEERAPGSCGLTPNSEFLKPAAVASAGAISCGLTPNSEFLKPTSRKSLFSLQIPWGRVRIFQGESVKTSPVAADFFEAPYGLDRQSGLYHDIADQ